MTLAPEKTNGHHPEALAGLLSPRQLEVLEMIAEGRSNPEIAAALYIECRTVERHIQEIFSRLGISAVKGGGSARVLAALRYLEARGMAEAYSCLGHMLCDGKTIIYCGGRQ